jgi:hypothetical protein
MEIDSLWFDVDAPAVAPPAITREQVLPLGSLSWENFERLCFRLAHRAGDVEDARIYGERGQAQEGIDLYVRRATGDYATWQCKRYQEVTTSDIKRAVTTFLDGDWASRTKLFRLAVAPSLNATELAEEIENQRKRCEAVNIIFEPLDRDRLSLMLKDHPDLVDDFFGRSWVEAFNGPAAAARLSGRKLSREQKLKARGSILILYTTHFQTVDGGIPAAAPVFRGAVSRVSVFDRYVEPTIELVESIIEQGQAPNTQPGSSTEDGGKERQATGFRRREIQTKIALSAGLATSDRFLLLGGAGFGKSAALRVILHSLLTDSGRFPALAKSWGQRLPLLLPFGFLTQHFTENEIPTVEGALKAWLKVLGARNDVLTLLEEMLSDERLLLLVDGLDEWQNREAAVAALTALSTYVQTRRLPLVATGRPLGFERISDFGPDWKRANLLPLTSAQQREFATYWFRHFHKAEGELDMIALEQAVTRDATRFAIDLSEDPALSELGGVPLLLSVLIYLRLTGHVLPRSRLAVLEELIKALLEVQPGRRAQAAMQRIDQSAARSRRIRHGIEYLAYRIHQEPNSLVLPHERAAQLLSEYFRTNLELPASEAEEWAARVLELGQHEFGVLAAPQEHHIGLLHRIFQEYLAAKHLARLPLDQVKGYCADSGCKAPWREVTLTLLQLIERQDDVDGLIDELRRPVADFLEEPSQQILLTRVAVAEINCSRRKAVDLISQVFSWIECGRWMPLRLVLVREVVAGLESEQVGASLAARVARWFPGRVSWLRDVPNAAAKQPVAETVSDLRIALYNSDNSYEYRYIAEALASFAEKSPELADEFIGILRGPAEPGLMGAALHALATGWPTHTALPSLLQAGSAAPAKELRHVATLARFNRGERSPEIRDALVKFCRQSEWPSPWKKEIVEALVRGWPRDPQLMKDALERMQGIYHPESWAPHLAIEYLLRGCPGDDAVARMVADQLAQEDPRHHKFNISDTYEALLAGFTKHPLLIPAAEAWLEKNAATHHSQLDIAVIAQLGGTLKCRQALLDWLGRGTSFPAWIISTLLEMSGRDDPEVQAVIANYMRDKRRRSEAVRWLPDIVPEPQKLGVMLRDILRDSHVFESCRALEILVAREGRDGRDLWSLVETRLANDKGGHYWRLGHPTLLKVWPEHPLIRQLAKSTVYGEDMSMSALYEAYGDDSEIRPLLDQTMQVLHQDLRFEIARAIEPLVRRGVPAAVAIAAQFRQEPNGEARTVAARAYARSRVHAGGGVQELIEAVGPDFTGFFLEKEPRVQAAVAALLELGRADLVAMLREDGRPLQLDTYSNSRHNWEFVATVVEHWESLAAVVPDIWERFNHSPIIATELAKAGKRAHALSQAQVFENAVRTGKQLEADQVRALIALHGRSALLRDLFLRRLQFMAGQNSMMGLERAGYAAMASYLTEHFRGDETVGQMMVSVATSTMIHDVGMIALCQGWPDSPPIAVATANLPTLIDSYEPVAAWLLAFRANARLMADYIVRYPDKLTKGYFGEPRDGIQAVRNRVETDQECRNLVFADLQNVTELNTRIALAKLLAPSMRNDPAFRAWISEQLRGARENSRVICELAFDVFANACKPVEFALLEAALTRY